MNGEKPARLYGNIVLMLSRRHFLLAEIAGPVVAAAPKYDLIVKGGRIIDASQKIDRIADVAIAGGKIAAIQPGIAAVAARATR